MLQNDYNQYILYRLHLEPGRMSVAYQERPWFCNDGGNNGFVRVYLLSLRISINEGTPGVCNCIF